MLEHTPVLTVLLTVLRSRFNLGFPVNASVTQKKDNVGVKFSAVDVMLLEEGLSPKASEEEIKKAKLAIEKKSGFTLITKTELKRLSSRTREGQKPGRRAAVSTNKTDTEEAALLEYIRRDLGPVAEALTKSQLLAVVLRLCQNFKTSREHGLFLNSSQRLAIHGIAEQRLATAEVFASKHQNGDLSLGASIAAEPTKSGVARQLRALKESVWTNAVKRTWQAVVMEATQSVSCHNGVEVSDRRAYQALRRALNLELSASEAVSLYNIAWLPVERGKKHSAGKTYGGTSRYRRHYPKASVPSVLKVARENLMALRKLVDGHWYCRINKSVEGLYLLVRAWGSSNHPDAIPSEAAAIEKVFLDAIREQGSGPFLPTSNEELDFGAPEIPDI